MGKNTVHTNSHGVLVLWRHLHPCVSAPEELSKVTGVEFLLFSKTIADRGGTKCVVGVVIDGIVACVGSRVQSLC